MDILEFIEALQRTFGSPHSTEKDRFFLTEINKIVNDDRTDVSLKMTEITVLFEGFYRHLEHSDFKQRLIIIRVQRWNKHFGTPTVPFLLSYRNQIDQTKTLFEQFDTLIQTIINVPWAIELVPSSSIDNDNSIIVDTQSISQVATPSSREITGLFTKTYNSMGGYTTTPCDPFSQEFIEHAKNSAKTGGSVLEIGAAFGAATLEAIANGATVFCNDIDPENLAVVRNRYLERLSNNANSITGDDTKLILIPGELPHELIGLPEKYFDAILICRVLHFFKGETIDESLKLMAKLLTPRGKIYIVCETPFLKNWQRFIPEFNHRVASNIEWPGEITNPADYESSGRAASLPKFVHWITMEVLERSLSYIGFLVEKASYINRAGQFPEDLLLPEEGRESVGAIGVNIGCEK